MNDALIQRAEILMLQLRYPDAEALWREALSNDPKNDYLFGQLAEATLQQHKYKEAMVFINNAIALNPECSDFYKIKARAFLFVSDFQAAEICLRKSISLNARNAHTYAIWAHVKALQNKFYDALNLTDKSLQLNPENLLALNTRSEALFNINRRQESFKTINDALKKNPEYAYTHSNYGWILMETGDFTLALQHFREAMKTHPGSEYARIGLAEAMKAQYLIYRIFLRYAYWMSKLPIKERFYFSGGVFIIIFAIYSLLGNGNREVPVLLLFYLTATAITFTSYVTIPISNLFLRLNPHGKFLLDDQKKMNSNFVGGCIALFLLGLLLYLISHNDVYLALAGFGILMTIPCSIIFYKSETRTETVLFTAALALTGLTGLANAFNTGEILNWKSILFLLLHFYFQFRLHNTTLIR
jgi:tetratricopeptide (TPR) repeat protein